MSDYYNPKRSANWNFGGKNWKLSRSKIDLFIECPKCFYIDNKLGTKRPPGYPFSLNTAVDHLLKKEFDSYREQGKRHPLMEKYDIDAIPFPHPELDVWRDNFEGIKVKHEPTGMTISGAVDDIWVSPDGKLHVVDYKATSKDQEVTLDADWQDGYKRQMEVYQWLLRKKGFDVSDIGYFVYANGKKDKDAFNEKLEFDMKIIPYEGDDSWIENTIKDIYDTVSKNSIPEKGESCDYCSYRDTVENVTENIESDEVQNNTLF